MMQMETDILITLIPGVHDPWTQLSGNPGAVLKACEKGLSFGCATEVEVEMAEFICEHLPHVEMVRMVNSGTEAVMSAVRAARGFTGKVRLLNLPAAITDTATRF